MTKASDNVFPRFLISEGGSTATPASGQVTAYAKADGLLYSKDDAGTETPLGGGTAHGAWTTYTPTLTASTTNPTLGSSILTGRYKAIDSKTYAIQIYYEVVTGGAFNVGSGNYEFLLPNSVTSGAVDQVLAAWMVDASASANFVGIARVTPSQTKVLRTYMEGVDAVSHNSPFAWATGDKLAISGTIEVA